MREREREREPRAARAARSDAPNQNELTPFRSSLWACFRRTVGLQYIIFQTLFIITKPFPLLHSLRLWPQLPPSLLVPPLRTMTTTPFVPSHPLGTRWVRETRFVIHFNGPPTLRCTATTASPSNRPGKSVRSSSRTLPTSWITRPAKQKLDFCKVVRCQIEKALRPSYMSTREQAESRPKPFLERRAPRS